MRYPNMMLLVAALALVSCGPLTAGPSTAGSTAPPGLSTGVAQVADTVTIKATQGLVIAELAYSTAGSAVKAAVAAHLITPGSATALRVRDLNRDVSRALEVARTARSGAEQAAEVAKAMTAIGQLTAATPKAN